MGLTQKPDKLLVAPEGVEPGVADHGGITEEAVLNGAGKLLEGLGAFTKKSELPGEIVETFRIAESSGRQLIAFLETLRAVAFEKSAKRG